MTSNVLIILGGGCAGLSLAMHLAKDHIPYDQVIIIEKRNIYKDDRTWCFWKLENTYLKDLVAHEWSAFNIILNKNINVVNCNEMPYQMIRSIDFYKFAIDTIKKSHKFKIFLGHEIKKVYKTSSKIWIIETNQGFFTGAVIVDTRPGELENLTPILWQSFLGQEIRCETKIFQNQIPDLMNFHTNSDDGIAFSYILPFSEKEGLIETTIFGSKIFKAEWRLNFNFYEKWVMIWVTGNDPDFFLDHDLDPVVISNTTISEPERSNALERIKWKT
jgi:lycopene beta-cyclase